MPIFRLRRPLRGYIFSALLCSALAAGLTSASGSAMAASEMQELAATLHAAEFSPRVDQLLKAGHPAQALELADLGLEKNTNWPAAPAKPFIRSLPNIPKFRSHTTTWR